jgi:hypothetical protein
LELFLFKTFSLFKNGSFKFLSQIQLQGKTGFFFFGDPENHGMCIDVIVTRAQKANG